MAKIAILSYYSGFMERGAETFVYELTKRLLKKHQVTILQSGEKLSIYQDLQSDKFKVITIKPYVKESSFKLNFFLKIFYLDLLSLKILLTTLKTVIQIIKGKYDVIITMNGGWQVAIIRVISKITKAKLVITGQAGIGRDDTWNLLWRPDVFVALTSSQLKWANLLAPEVKKVLIPNGVDLSTFNPQVKPKKLELKKPIVICTSALDSHKQVDLTIKAVAKTKNLSLLLLGDGQLKGKIDSQGKRLLGKRYQRLVVPHGKISKYYRTGFVFTLASKTEAFGTSYIEAMACNLPVVATNDESRQEIIGSAGVLTNPQNTNQYAKDLKIAAQTNYRSIPYDQALKFSWNKIAQKYSNLIKELSI